MSAREEKFEQKVEELEVMLEIARRERDEARAQVATLREALETQTGLLRVAKIDRTTDKVPAALASTATAAAEHDARVRAEARREALEGAAQWFESKAPPCPYDMVPGRLRALTTLKPLATTPARAEEPPCGGSRCHKADDGTWIHSSKSYGTCAVRTEENS